MQYEKEKKNDCTKLCYTAGGAIGLKIKLI